MEAQTGRVTMLLVDDDPRMIALLRTVIEATADEHIEIETLTNPALARERIERGGVQILLTDLEMPGINGLELLCAAKRRNPLTQVLFLTGHSTATALFDALQFGATDYLIKPFDTNELRRLVEEAYLRTQRWQRAFASTWVDRRVAGQPVLA